jgi:hypothetical protein
MNKKTCSKRKKVVIDVIDGKIINDTHALKLENVEQYIEKNGFKIIKVFSILFVLFVNINFAKAMNILSLGLDSMPSYKLAFTLNLLIILFILAILCIIAGLKYGMIQAYYLGCIILILLGILILSNGFNPFIGLFVFLIGVYAVWSVQ